MPFTPSHPALVLPFSWIKHNSVSMSALIIGSMTPDFEYFIRMKLTGRYGHSIEGMFFLDLPLAFILTLVFHQLVKKSLIDNLPGYFFRRLQPLRNFDLLSYLRKHYIGFTVCLLTGIASHILWDSFTHANAYFVDRIPFLSTPVRIDGISVLPLFRYLQHISTIIGAFFIIIFFHRLPEQRLANNPSVRFWIVVIAVAAAIFALRALLTFEYLGDVVVSLISSVLAGLIVSGAIFKTSAVRHV